MGRRRQQHSVDLALASDQILWPDQNNIRSGLATFHARLPGLSQSSLRMLPQSHKERQALEHPLFRSPRGLVRRWCRKRAM